MIQLLEKLVIPAEARGRVLSTEIQLLFPWSWIPVPRLKTSRTSFTGMTT